MSIKSAVYTSTKGESRVERQEGGHELSKSLGTPLEVMLPPILPRTESIPPSAMRKIGKNRKSLQALTVLRSSSTKSSSQETQPAFLGMIPNSSIREGLAFSKRRS